MSKKGGGGYNLGKEREKLRGLELRPGGREMHISFAW